MNEAKLIDDHSGDGQWDSDAYINEMEKRFNDFETGKIKPLTLDELEAYARWVYKDRG